MERWAGSSGEARSEGTPFEGGEDHLYGAFFRAGMDGVLFADAGGEVLDANDEACRVLGRARYGLLAPGGGAVFDPSDPRLAGAREQQRQAGSFRGRLRVLRGSGEEAAAFEAQVTVAGYADGLGGEWRLVIVVREAGGRGRPDALKRAAKEEEWFSSVAGYLSDAVAVFEDDGTLRYVSPSLERILGYAPEELVGTLTLDTVHPEDLERAVKEGVAAWASPGVAPPFTIRTRRKDGSWAHMEVAMNNLLDDERVRAVVMLARDVTERVRAEEEARRLNEELERRTAELEAALAELENEGGLRGIAHLGPEGRYLWVNDEFCRITGYSRGEVLDSGFRAATHPDDLGLDLDRARRELSGGSRGYSSEARYLRKDGSRAWVSMGASSARRETDDPGHLVLRVEDLGRRKRNELALRSLTRREKEVLMLLARGDSNPQISRRLKVSLSTAKYHVQNVFEKLGVRDRRGAALRAVELGLLGKPR